MKVIEKGTDRNAEVHIHVEGDVKPLGEYGQYVDASDKAICCYVPVEEGHKVNIRGKFTGTTLTIAYDAVVDGIHRKANLYDAKTVYPQVNKKLDVAKFLCKTSKGIIDTDMSVAPISGTNFTQGEATETIGTIELRLYITRQLGVEHALTGIEKYHSLDDVLQNDGNRSITYKRLPLTFSMAFEENSELLERRKSGREQRKMDLKRPGIEPWAIFRFHYRSREAIKAHDMGMSFDPKSRPSKTIIEPHALDLEAVPPLPLDAKPAVNDGDTLTRASSTAPPDVPYAPTKSTSKATSAKSPNSNKKTQSQLAFVPAPTTTTTMATEKERTLSPDPDPNQSPQEADKDLLAQVFSKPAPKPSTTTMTPPTFSKPAASIHTNGIVSSSPIAADKSNGATKDDTSTRKEDQELAEKATRKPVEKVRPNADDTIAVDISRSKPTATTNNGAAKPTGRAVSKAATPATATATAPSPALVKGPTKKHPQVVVSSTKKPPTKPAPIITGSGTQENLVAPAPSTTPTKRIGEPTNVTNPDIKRAKTVPAPPTPTPPTTPTFISRLPPGTPSPRPFSIERKVAEQRKRLEAMRQKRLETAKKQEELDKKMEPYKKRMADELERIERELIAEEAAAAEDEEHLMVSAKMLKEFEMGDRAE